jgi:hypothetical protein
MSLIPDKFVKMERLYDSDVIDEVGFSENTKRLYVKLKGAKPTVLCFSGVPRFRHSGLLTASRKDEYFKNFIKPTFLCQEVQKIPGQP